MSLTLVPRTPLPKGEKTTEAALMPHTLCCVSGEEATVYRNREKIRKFKHFENGMLKLKKLWDRERVKARKLYSKVSPSGIFIKGSKKIIVKEEVLGFENIV